MSENGSKTRRVPYPDHPDRCQALGQGGNQCLNFCEPPSKNCLLHGANIAKLKDEKASMNLYRIAQFQARMDEFIQANGTSDTSHVLGLRSEIALLRMKLESIVNQCKGPADLLIHSQKINMTIQLVGKLVVDAKKLESSLGHLLDRTTVNALCDNIVGIVSKHVKDVEVLEVIAKEIGSAVDLAVLQRADSEDKNV